MHKWYTAHQVSIVGLASALRDPRLRWVYAERTADIVLTRHDALLDGSLPLERWTHGRAFGPELELAWWCTGDQLQARTVTTGGEPPRGIDWEPRATQGWEPQTQRGRDTLLLGERDPDAPGDDPKWSEVRIPRYLEYPVAGNAARVALVRQTYQRQGVVVAWRLVEVRGVDQ
jgi:hypothetical protein